MASTTRIPIDLRVPRTTSLSGNAYWSPVNDTTSTVDFARWVMVKDVESKVYGYVQVPATIGGTPAAKIILTIRANATTGVTSLQVSTLAVADGESYDQALTAETRQDITVPATAKMRKEVSFTLTNPPSASDHLLVEVFHDGDQANDTLGVDTELVAAELEIDLT